MTTKPPPTIDPRLAYLYDENGVYYPETDGVPLADGLDQEQAFVSAVSTLRGYFRDRPNTAISGNTFIYYRQGSPQQFVSPDCYVAFDVDLDHLFYRNTYRVWEMGKIPDFAMEIASENTARHDTGAKRLLYAELGFGEYWRYDPTPNSEYYGKPLVGERLVDGEYVPFEINEEPDGLIWVHSPTLGLDLCWNNGVLKYRIPETGEFLPDYDEAMGALRETENRLQESEDRRQESEDRLQESEDRRQESEDRLQESEARRQESDDRLQESEDRLQALEARRQESEARLETSEAQRLRAEAEAAELREQLRRLQSQQADPS